MNQIFHTKRFLLLLATILEGRKKYLLAVPILIIIIQFITFLQDLLPRDFETSPYYKLKTVDYFYPGFLAGTVIIAIIFSGLYQSDRKKIVQVLLPASTFEKWSAILLSSLVPFTIIYFILFVLLNHTMAAMVNDHIGTVAENSRITIVPFFPYTYVLFHYITACWAIASFILVGTTYFKKAPIILTLVSLMGFCYLGFYINLGIIHLILPEGSTLGHAFPFEKINLISLVSD